MILLGCSASDDDEELDRLLLFLEHCGQESELSWISYIIFLNKNKNFASSRFTTCLIPLFNWQSIFHKKYSFLILILMICDKIGISLGIRIIT